MAWDACTLEPFFLLRWIECHPSLAGYIQAIGTVLAVGVAMAAPAIESYFARRQAAKDLRARTLGFIEMLATPITDVGVDATRARAKWLAWKHGVPQAHLWTDLLNEMLVKIPPELMSLGYANDFDLALLGPQRQVYKAAFQSNSVRQQVQGMYTVAAADWGNVWRMMDQALIDVENAVFLAR